MNAAKVFYWIYGVFASALTVWGVASYIDAALNPLRGWWNLFDFLIERF